MMDWHVTIFFPRCVQWATDGGAEAPDLWAEVWELDVIPAEDGGQSGCRRSRLLRQPQTAALYAQGIRRDSLTDTTEKNQRHERRNPDPSLCFSGFRLSCPSVTRSFILLLQRLFICCRKERWRTGKNIKLAESMGHTHTACVWYWSRNFPRIFGPSLPLDKVDFFIYKMWLLKAISF